MSSSCETARHLLYNIIWSNWKFLKTTPIQHMINIIVIHLDTESHTTWALAFGNHKHLICCIICIFWFCNAFSLGVSTNVPIFQVLKTCLDKNLAQTNKLLPTVYFYSYRLKPPWSGFSWYERGDDCWVWYNFTIMHITLKIFDLSLAYYFCFRNALQGLSCDAGWSRPWQFLRSCISSFLSVYLSFNLSINKWLNTIALHEIETHIFWAFM
jgi:hypothetical protein